MPPRKQIETPLEAFIYSLNPQGRPTDLPMFISVPRVFQQKRADFCMVAVGGVNRDNKNMLSTYL